MRITSKPVRKCHGCLLNLGDRCWGYRFPQRQWRRRGGCPGYDNPVAYELYHEWLRQPSVKTPRELRQDARLRSRPSRRVYHLEDGIPATRRA